jgi:hypothetical protein
MVMSSPYRNTERRRLARPARTFISAIRRGASEAEAAEKAGVSVGEARAWRRDPAFEELYGRARRGEGRPVFMLLSSIPDDDPDPDRDERLREQGRQWIANRGYNTDKWGRLQ